MGPAWPGDAAHKRKRGKQEDREKDPVGAPQQGNGDPQQSGMPLDLACPVFNERFDAPRRELRREEECDDDCGLIEEPRRGDVVEPPAGPDQRFIDGAAKIHSHTTVMARAL